MASAVQSGMVFLAGMLMAGLATAVCAQEPQYPKPTDLPNPYRLAEDWPTLPPSMNGGRWGEVIRVHVWRRASSATQASLLPLAAWQVALRGARRYRQRP